MRRSLTLPLLAVAGLAVPTSTPVSAQVVESAVLVGAGDISECTNDRDGATARLIDAIPGTVFTLGDNAYEIGTAAEFRNCYGPTWGRHLDRTMPAIGDHEYDSSSSASGYFGYFGERAHGPDGWYSYTRGAWKVIVLNSRCEAVGGCGTGSRQHNWLRAELAASAADCTLAYFHRTLFSSGTKSGPDPNVRPLWQALYDHGADVVMSGHSHFYERFAPQTPSGQYNPDFGIPQFTVATGGRALRDFRSPPAANSQRRIKAHGVMKLTLHANTYDWEFIPIPESTGTDAGTGSCHGRPGGVPPPPPGPSVSFGAVADARVVEGSPDTNFGSAARLDVDGSPREQSYLRFTAAGLSGSVERAVLRLFVTNGSGNGPELYQTTGAWEENTLTWNNRPGRSPAALVGDRGSTPAGSYVEYDVTSVVSGNGTFNFKLDPDSDDGTDFNSDEAASNRPQLVVTTSGGGGEDTDPPETTITSGPPRPTSTSSSATFEFTSDEANSTFECRRDGQAWFACTSPHTQTNFGDNVHNFDVRARDGAGHADPTPARWTWTVDAVP